MRAQCATHIFEKKSLMEYDEMLELAINCVVCCEVVGFICQSCLQSSRVCCFAVIFVCAVKTRVLEYVLNTFLCLSFLDQVCFRMKCLAAGSCGVQECTIKVQQFLISKILASSSGPPRGNIG